MKFRFKKIFVLLAFFVMALTTSGVYASWEYLTGGLTFDNTEIDVNVESFDYPEWTVRFYTGGSLSGQYGGGRKEVASHTFYNKNEEFTFPTNDIGNHPTTTMMYWCTQPIYYFENDVEVYQNNNATKASLSDVLGDLYEPNKAYKVDDIKWNEDNTLDLYEIVEENYCYVGPQIEKIKYGECKTYNNHINTFFCIEIPYAFPHVDACVSVGGRFWNDEAVKGDAFGFSLLYADTDVEFSSLHNDIVNNHTISANTYFKDDITYRLVKDLPEITGTRVTQDSERDFGFVNSSEQTVETYDTSNKFKIYVSPGMFFYLSVNDEETVTTVYSNYMLATEKHCNCTFIHYRIGEVMLNEAYTSVDTPTQRIDVCNFYESENEFNYSYRWAEDYDYNYCVCSNHVGGTTGGGSSGNEGGGCLLEDTPILTSNGTYVPIQDIDSGDMVKSFNHETGKFEDTPILEVAHKDEGQKTMTVTELAFSDDTTLKIAHNHALYDLTLNEYAIIDKDNVNQFIGHKFYSYKNNKVTLVSSRNYVDTVRVYVPFTKGNLNCIASNMLTNPGVYARFLMNIFDFEDDMTINQSNKQKDIAKYGLFSYEDLKQYVNPIMYKELNLQYLKIGLGKKLYNMDDVIANLSIYKQYFE